MYTIQKNKKKSKFSKNSENLCSYVLDTYVLDTSCVWATYVLAMYVWDTYVLEMYVWDTYI